MNEASGAAKVAAPKPRQRVNQDAVVAAAKALRTADRCVVAVPRRRCRDWACARACRSYRGEDRCALSAEYANWRLERRRSRASLRIPYVVDVAMKALKDVRKLVLVGAEVPVVPSSRIQTSRAC